MNKLPKIILFELAVFIGLLLAFPVNIQATNLAEQTQAWGNYLPVWQAIQELGNSLSGPAVTFTFRVKTDLSNLSQFDFTVQNSLIYDKDNNNSFINACTPVGYNPQDPVDGLIFNTTGVPQGYEDVSIDFSCRNYNFIPGHRYLAQIGNANMAQFGGKRIQFAAGAYGPGGVQTTDFFPAGGVRYAFDNAVCDPVRYVWNSQTANNGCNIWTTPKDDLYFVLSDTPYQPPAPTPFLDLPWDYEGKGLSFNEAANSMSSFFDHEYPLLSSGLGEPSQSSGSIIKFDDPERSGESYSSHDGYDYAKLAKVNIGDPVLAAAAGEATYINSCGACGNMILIDHGNGYQTKYLHLQKDGLIVDVPGQKVQVEAHQQIGKVGATGNVSPSGDAGAHIHFGVFQDKNKDGSFDDNIPDGVTDPFGWQSKEADPWPSFAFSYGGQSRTGNTSFYLWTKKLDNLNATLASNGGVFTTERYTFNFPSGATNQNLNLNIQSSPNIRATNSLVSIGSTIAATATDLLGNLITQFQNLFTITIGFNGFDLTRYNQDTISIYSSQDGVNWTKEDTTIDWTEKTASATLSHFTHFALLAERVDITPPTTVANLSGDKGQDNWFRSDVQVSLNAADNEGGLGVDYTMYRLPEGDWEIYTSPLTFSSEGHYKIEFYSADNDENLEEIKTVEFDIDKTPPEAKLYIDQATLDLVVEGIDLNATTTEALDRSSSSQLATRYSISDLAGNIAVLLIYKQNDAQVKFSVRSIKYNDPEAIQLSFNQLSTQKINKDNFYKTEQKFIDNNEVKISINYHSGKNESSIYSRENGVLVLKETQVGLTILNLFSENSTLKYSY